MKPRFFSVTLACLTLNAAFAAEKQVPLPKDLPAYGALKPLPTPGIRQLKLDNGLLVWLVRTPGFPKVSYALAVRGGSAADPKDRPGLAGLLADTVTQGTANRGAKQIAEEAQGAGG